MAGGTRARETVDTLPGAWLGFVGGPWVDDVDVRDFLQRNYTPYTGDASFLAGPTPRTRALCATVDGLVAAERHGGYRVDASTPSRITSRQRALSFSGTTGSCARRFAATGIAIAIAMTT